MDPVHEQTAVGGDLDALGNSVFNLTAEKPLTLVRPPGLPADWRPPLVPDLNSDLLDGLHADEIVGSTRPVVIRPIWAAHPDGGYFSDTIFGTAANPPAILVNVWAPIYGHEGRQIACDVQLLAIDGMAVVRVRFGGPMVGDLVIFPTIPGVTITLVDRLSLPEQRHLLGSSMKHSGPALPWRA